MNRLKSRQHLGRALDRAGGRRNFRMASELRKWISPILPWVYNMYIYIYVYVTYEITYLTYHAKRATSSRLGFICFEKMTSEGTQLFVQVGQQINRRLIPKVSTSNIHNYIYIYTRIYVLYIYMILYAYMYTCNWYVYNIIYLYIISLTHIYIYIHIIYYYISYCIYWL